MVASADFPCLGAVAWRPIGPHGNWEIGCGLLTEHRGCGIGSEAQRLLVEYLFATTPANRVQAGTEADTSPSRERWRRQALGKRGSGGAFTSAPACGGTV